MCTVTDTIEVFDRIDDEQLLEFCMHVSRSLARELNVPEEPVVGGSWVPTRACSLILMRNEQGEPVSLIVWMPWEDGAFIGLAWTDQHRRRQGLYSRLIERLAEECRARGMKHITASVHGHNAVSMRSHTQLLGQPWIVNFRKGL